MISSSFASLSKVSSSSSCSVRLSTLVKKINEIRSPLNASIIFSFFQYMQEKDSSENHQVNNLKVVLDFAKFLGPLSFYEVKERGQILSFLEKKIKPVEMDPERRSITTWNHYLNRIKLFMRWLHNYYSRRNDDIIIDNEEWITPEFSRIKNKQTKRVSPYSENEIWERDEILSLLKYETSIRNKAILTLMWDLNARPHEITLLRIKNIRLKEAYGEGEVPYQAKTGSGPVLLMLSFCYVRDWINQHPFKNEANARLICNEKNGSPIRPKNIWNIMNQLRKRIIRLVDQDQIPEKERQKLELLLKTKKWNPYCVRHSSINAILIGNPSCSKLISYAFPFIILFFRFIRNIVRFLRGFPILVPLSEFFNPSWRNSRALMNCWYLRDNLAAVFVSITYSCNLFPSAISISIKNIFRLCVT